MEGVNMASKVGPQGQIVIEKPIREMLGLKPGYIAVQKLVGDHVEIRFFPPEHRRSLKGILAGMTNQAIQPDQWSDAREQAWSEVTAQEQDFHGAGNG